MRYFFSVILQVALVTEFTSPLSGGRLFSDKSINEHLKDKAVSLLPEGLVLSGIAAGILGLSCCGGSKYAVPEEEQSMGAKSSKLSKSQKNKARIRRRRLEQEGQARPGNLNSDGTSRTFTNIDSPQRSKFVASLDNNPFNLLS